MAYLVLVLGALDLIVAFLVPPSWARVIGLSVGLPVLGYGIYLVA
jgi:hypothetical protein